MGFVGEATLRCRLTVWSGERERKGGSSGGRREGDESARKTERRGGRRERERS